MDEGKDLSYLQLTKAAAIARLMRISCTEDLVNLERRNQNLIIRADGNITSLSNHTYSLALQLHGSHALQLIKTQLRTLQATRVYSKINKTENS